MHEKNAVFHLSVIGFCQADFLIVQVDIGLHALYILMWKGLKIIISWEITSLIFLKNSQNINEIKRHGKLYWFRSQIQHQLFSWKLSVDYEVQSSKDTKPSTSLPDFKNKGIHPLKNQVSPEFFLLSLKIWWFQLKKTYIPN